MSVPAAHISCCNLQLSIHHLEEDSSRLRRELPYSISCHRKPRLVLPCLCLGWEFIHWSFHSKQRWIWQVIDLTCKCDCRFLPLRWSMRPLVRFTIVSAAKAWHFHRLQENLLTSQCELLPLASFHRKLMRVWRFCWTRWTLSESWFENTSLLVGRKGDMEALMNLTGLLICGWL